MACFDVHTHTKKNNGILNCFPEDETPDTYFSVGIHPWHIKDADQQFQLVKEKALLEQCLAIGECGLDPFSEVEMEKQKDVFLQHIELANALQKPLIIHLVKAYNDFFDILKSHSPAVPVIIHGFNKKPSVMEQFNRPDMYVSFGESLFQDKNKASESLKNTENFFLETDDSSFSIEEVYLQAAKILNWNQEKLEENLKNRIESVFNARF